MVGGTPPTLHHLQIRGDRVYEDIDLLVKVANSVGTLGILIVVVIAFFKGWVIPVSIQARMDQLKSNFADELKILEKQNSDFIGEMQIKFITLYEKHNADTKAMLEKRIADLESLLRERELRVEQGVTMLSTFIDAQDKLGLLAKKLEDK